MEKVTTLWPQRAKFVKRLMLRELQILVSIPPKSTQKQTNKQKQKPHFTYLILPI